MRRLWGKFLCFFGIHDWRAFGNPAKKVRDLGPRDGYTRWVTCNRCWRSE